MIRSTAEGGAPPVRRGAFTIGGEPSSAVEERQKDLFLGQNGQDVPKGGQDGHSGAPAVEMPWAPNSAAWRRISSGATPATS